MHLLIRKFALAFLLLCCNWTQAAPPASTLRIFPTGPIYDYRWKLLELVLGRTADMGAPQQLVPYPEDVTQNRAMLLLQAGAIDVIALGTNAEREAMAQPIRIDILRGIVGYRVLVIRAADQARIARMDADTLRRQLSFGLNSQWADLPIMQANGFTVETSSSHENLFGMLTAGRFDAFPRGLNEAARELQERRHLYPELALEQGKALYFPYPIYFWVNRKNTALAKRIERGLQLTLADGTFRKLFESYHAAEIATLQKERRQVIRLPNPILPKGNAEPDTSWWWQPPRTERRHDKP
ncbi:transporter substrate-binding domain-containing protein [Janthinobacterium sp. 17J80-10]|uniref:substrate-binding periplasmic protein n=1 Tax=Janthinobacterium sp. 17J80-10 TaxID=2497863 RepID=UPI001F50669C|nr:transporter substrate-binding domain-containing protein [Janthinobacterium sp. 17J80-10]